jgi:hypothetical protein
LNITVRKEAQLRKLTAAEARNLDDAEMAFHGEIHGGATA